MTARVPLTDPRGLKEDTQNVDGKVVRSHWRIVWGQRIGPAACPFMRRWFLETPWGSIRLHHFIRSDETADKPEGGSAHYHDHPWSFLTVVLLGSYRDVAPCWRCGGGGERTHPRRPSIVCNKCRGSGRLVDRLRLGSIRWRPAEHRHAVETEGAWTICVTGPERRLWGFWPDGLFRPMADYFTRYGYAPCE